MTNQVNIWREIQEDKAGLIENDDDAGARALLDRWLAMDESARAEMRANASRCFNARFDVRNTSVQLAATLQAIA